MTQTVNIISNNQLFQQPSNLGNFGIIQTMVTASSPLAIVYNGQQRLGQFISQLISSSPQGVQFRAINEIYQFNLYKVIKPKIIYARYVSRVTPVDFNQANIQSSNFQRSVTFKIDYDACCVGQMMLLLTTDIELKDLSNTPITINGYSANGVSQLQIQPQNVQSLQFSYGKDFIWNYIDKISLGWCNTGGGNISWHQEVPSEIAYIYHNIILSIGQSQTTRRCCREDEFSIEHNPYHMYGDFSFAIKADNQLNDYTNVTNQNPIQISRQSVSSQNQKGFNELAMYWVDTKIKELKFNENYTNTSTANGMNWSIGNNPIVTDVQTTDSETGLVKYLAGFNITYISDIKYGNQDTQYTLYLSSNLANAQNVVSLPQTAQIYNVPVEDIIYTQTIPQPPAALGYLFKQGFDTTPKNLSIANYTSGSTAQTNVDIEYLVANAFGYKTLVGTTGASIAPTTSDTGKFYIVNNCVVSNQSTTLVGTPLNSASVGYTLPISNALPLQVITATAQGVDRSQILNNISRIGSNVYPTFNITYSFTADESATPQQFSLTEQVIMVPYVILNQDGTYQFCTSLIKAKSQQFFSFAQFRMTVTQKTNNGATVTNDMKMTEAKLSGLQLTVSDKTVTPVQYFYNQGETTLTTMQYPVCGYVNTDTSANLMYYGMNVIQPSLVLNSQPIFWTEFQKTYDNNTENTPIINFITSSSNVIALSTVQTYGFNQYGQFSVQCGTQSALEEYTVATGIYTFGTNVSAIPYFNSVIGSNITGVITNDFYWSAPTFWQFMTGYNDILEFVNALSATIQKQLFQQTGAISPYLNVGSFNYLNLEVEKYDQNDYALNGLSWYYTMSINGQNTYSRQPNPNTLQGTYDIYRYNAAILNNHQNEEYSPSIQNLDYQSIHSFRKYHGVVDFYFPLQFLFICNGIRNSFPHYACSAQSIVVKFDFINPISLMNTCLAVDPTAIDKMDFSRNCRLLINRVNNFSVLENNVSNMGYVLYYNRYQWVPEMLDVITEYRYYAWVIKNYERQTKFIDVTQAGQYQDLYKYTRSVFYTKIWCFVVSKETLQVIENQGGWSNILPLQVNKYNLPIWDVLTYRFNSTGQGNTLNGSELEAYDKAYNSVMSYTPFESFKLTTESSISMTDDLPARFQMFADYLMLDWTQEHSPLRTNNLYQFNLDPIYHQEDAPNAIYSPAYGPQFKIQYKPKQYSNSVDRYGVILVSECINISYIQAHIMLVKYQTNN